MKYLNNNIRCCWDGFYNYQLSDKQTRAAAGVISMVDPDIAFLQEVSIGHKYSHMKIFSKLTKDLYEIYLPAGIDESRNYKMALSTILIKKAIVEENFNSIRKLTINSSFEPQYCGLYNILEIQQKNMQRLLLINVHMINTYNDSRPLWYRTLRRDLSDKFWRDVLDFLREYKNENPTVQVIMAGDFNSYENSNSLHYKEIQELDSLLHDSYVPNQEQNYTYYSDTYTARYDRIYTSSGNSNKSKIIQQFTFSDHYPVLLEL